MVWGEKAEKGRGGSGSGGGGGGGVVEGGGFLKKRKKAHTHTKSRNIGIAKYKCTRKSPKRKGMRTKGTAHHWWRHRGD